MVPYSETAWGLTVKPIRLTVSRKRHIPRHEEVVEHAATTPADKAEAAMKRKLHSVVMRSSRAVKAAKRKLQASSGTAKEEWPDLLCCPITKMGCTNPVLVLGSGHTYDKDAIEEYWTWALHLSNVYECSEGGEGGV